MGAKLWRGLARRPSLVALAQLAAIACGALTFLVLIAVVVTPYWRRGPGRGASDAQFHAALDRDAPAMLRYFHVPGMVVSTVENGAPGATYAYGYADVAAGRRMTPDTVFRVASLSKSLTAWGVLRLAEDGKVSLDAPVRRYLAEWPVAPSPFPADAVTVRRLLQHASGLNGGDDSFRDPSQPAPSTLALLGRLGPGPAGRPGPPRLVAPADSGFIYSVPGYTLLQLMIEEQSGQPFAAYMQRTVLSPLGMTSSSFAWDADWRGRTATPYDTSGQPVPLTIPDDTAADALFATAPDLARFVAAPLPDPKTPTGAGVLSPKTVNDVYLGEAKTPGLTHVVADQAGLGYFLEQGPAAPPLMTNIGLDPGWTAFFMMSPTTGDGVVILTNSDGGAPAIAQVLSLWSSWRGLPTGNLTTGYRTAGLTGAAFISLLVALDVAYGASLVIELRRRRFGLGGRLSSTALELGLAMTVLILWSVSFAAVRTLPVLHAVGSGMIVTLVVVALARTLFPLRDTPGDPTATARRWPPGLGLDRDGFT